MTDTVFRTVGGVLQGFTTSYTYDALNRVVAVEDPAGSDLEEPSTILLAWWRRGPTRWGGEPSTPTMTQGP